MRIVTFGEIMLRLSPEGYTRLFQSDRLVTSFGGAEANVAMSLSLFGMDAAFVTRLPRNPVGEAAERYLRALKVDTSGVVWGGDRLGLYYLETGGVLRGNRCVYDRAHSAVAEARPVDFDWEKLLEGADWFHFTGITPALSPALADICLEACQTARRMGVKVSCDLNFRPALWTAEAARAVMTRLCAHVDVCIANEGEVRDIFGTVPDGQTEAEQYLSLARKASAQFGFEKVALTLYHPWTVQADDWAGMLYDSRTDRAAYSREYRLTVIDRVGIGDSFGAGLIYGLMSGYDDREAIDFAVAASALKHSVEGDVNLVTADEVRRVMDSPMTGFERL